MSEFINKKYSLEERTFIFSKKLIALCKMIRKDIVIIPLVTQVIRSGTSIGANYREANGASSRSDFRNKIYVCKKEAKETQYWLYLLLDLDFQDNVKEEIKELLDEDSQFIRMFSKITQTISLTHTK